MDGAQVWLRWAQFIDLALVFGVPFTAYLLGNAGSAERGGWFWASAVWPGLASARWAFS
jgi:hypothetical protein